ncbi:MAG: Gfo/Idh/MocA family protein [Acutalibacteraceae bacterium]
MKTLLVGCGSIAQVHAQALHQLGREIAGFADIRPERAQKMADTYGGRAYASLDDMLANEQADVLHICTPHYLHVPMAVAALEKGLHVLMEKPPAIVREEESTLFRAREQAKKQVGVCFQNRYNPATVQALSLLQTGKLGAIKGARAFVTGSGRTLLHRKRMARRLENRGGGVLINQSIHTLDLLCYLLGDPVQVSATTANHHLQGVIEVEDSAEAYITFAGGQTALFYATTAHCTDAPVYVQIVCEKGTVTLEGDDMTVTGENGYLTHTHFAPLHHVGKDCWGASHLMLMQDFYDCLEKGKAFGIPYEDACRTLNLMLGIYESARTGQAVPCDR